MDNYLPNLKILRVSKKILQEDMASLLKCNLRTYQRYERGETEPNIATLFTLADYFGVSLDYLTGRIPHDYLSLLEEAEDEYLLALVLERKKNDTGVRYSFEEILAEDGLTLEDIDNMEDVELEDELPR